jgi:hypothetical protein
MKNTVLTTSISLQNSDTFLSDTVLHSLIKICLAQGSVVCAAGSGAIEKQEPLPIGDVAKRSLEIAAKATGQIGWISFWTQLALSIVSAVILLFSVAFTSQVSICRDGNRRSGVEKGG